MDDWSSKFHNRIVLSDEQEASNGDVECVGEKITVLTSDVWPRRVWASWTDNEDTVSFVIENNRWMLEVSYEISLEAIEQVNSHND